MDRAGDTLPERGKWDSSGEETGKCLSAADSGRGSDADDAIAVASPPPSLGSRSMALEAGSVSGDENTLRDTFESVTESDTCVLELGRRRSRSPATGSSSAAPRDDDEDDDRGGKAVASLGVSEDVTSASGPGGIASTSRDCAKRMGTQGHDTGDESCGSSAGFATIAGRSSRSFASRDMEQKKTDGGPRPMSASTMWLLRRGGSALRRVPALARGTSSTAKDAVRQKPETPMQRALPILFHMEDLARFPDLLKKPVAVHDVPVYSAPSAYGSSVALFNEEPFFPTPPPSVLAIMTAGSDQGEEVNSESYLSAVTPLSPKEIRQLHRYNITIKRVVNMTGKGRTPSWYSLVVAGNGRGLVGYGEGKDTNISRANKKAFHAAVKNMDLVSVHRSKSGANTLESPVEGRWGATRVVMRPRPAGFGLRVPDVLHPIARAAGFTDLGAAIYGSSNTMNVVKAALQVLWGGSAPIGMGGGIRGPMRRGDRGQGALSRREMELSRGRRLEELDV